MIIDIDKFENNYNIGEVIQLFTDGGCSGNPGPAGAGVYLKYKHFEKRISHWIGNATNNIAELFAVKIGLQNIYIHHIPVLVFCDSQYVIGSLSKPWNPKSNRGLIKKIKICLEQFNVITFKHVKGHSGIHGNEIADQLATLAYKNKSTNSWEKYI